MVSVQSILQAGFPRVYSMTTQSEALKFGPQWIRKLSDCALPSQRVSAKSPVNRPREPASNLTDDIPGTKCAHSLSEKHVKKISEGVYCTNMLTCVAYLEVDHVSSNVWNPLLASNFEVGDKKDVVLSRLVHFIWTLAFVLSFVARNDRHSPKYQCYPLVFCFRKCFVIVVVGSP